MKIIFVTLLAVSSLAFGGQENAGIGYNLYNPGAIYEALNVEAVALNPGVAGVGHFRKTVGGLTCEKSTIIMPNAKPKYSCEIDQKAENFGAIYEALKAKVKVLNPGIVGAARLQKSVGGLSCIKATIVVPQAKPSYSCTMVD
ncbi:MAG: hypothetical protein H7256_10175 [Bdellovibrio sp.]|nr:hypothetical protein [Bdellovibrio sp.]